MALHPFPPFSHYLSNLDARLISCFFLLGQVHIIFQENNAEEADWYYYIEE